MDSVSHILIGAAIGEVVLGKKIGRWSMLIGALAKTCPDFDLLYTGLTDARMYLCHHRGHTHSLFWELLYGIPLAFIFYYIFRKKVSFWQMLSLWMICLWGHSLLDLCTNYGTRLWLPFTNESYALNSISIVDLVFTLPMLLLSLASLFFSNKNNIRYKLNQYLLVYCLSYLGLTFVNKLYMNKIFAQSLTQNNVPHEKFMTNPFILNNVLWYANAVNDSTIYTAEYSLLDKDKNITWTAYPRNMQLAKSHPDTMDMKHLAWFDKGYSICKQDGDTLDYYAVKFGKNQLKDAALEKSFVFHYNIFFNKGEWQFTMTEPKQSKENTALMAKELWERIKGNK
jgi:inner membrane protein